MSDDTLDPQLVLGLSRITGIPVDDTAMAERIAGGAGSATDPCRGQESKRVPGRGAIWTGCCWTGLGGVVAHGCACCALRLSPWSQNRT